MKLYVVDAFAEQLFEGNPAAVCVLEHYPKDELLQQITNENNLSETAFVVKENDGYRLRWFTPGGEIDLCGHATLAAGYVLMRDYVPEVTEVRFHTLSGVLIVRRKGELYEMEFPIYSLTPVAVTDDIVNAIGVRPAEAWIGRDLLCVMVPFRTIVFYDCSLSSINHPHFIHRSVPHRLEIHRVCRRIICSIICLRQICKLFLHCRNIFRSAYDLRLKI